MSKKSVLLFLVIMIVAFAGCTSHQEAKEEMGCVHTWKNATCQTPKMCTICNEIMGTVADHNYSSLKCIDCGYVDPKAKEISTALKNCERYFDYLAIDAKLLQSNCDLYKIAGKTSYLIDVQNQVTEIVESLAKIYGYCSKYQELDGINTMCQRDFPMITTDHISSFERFAAEVESMVPYYQKLCKEYNY